MLVAIYRISCFQVQKSLAQPSASASSVSHLNTAQPCSSSDLSMSSTSAATPIMLSSIVSPASDSDDLFTQTSLGWDPNDVSDESENEDEQPFTYEDAQKVYDDFMPSIERSTLKLVCVALMDNFVHGFHLKEVAAAQEVGSMFGFNEKTVRYWRKDFYENRGEFTESRQGKYTREHAYIR